uniref:Uncharacterized protein n=1 Tax=Eutreptiella gymnastica TaxID=73025 RepID=A0A7S1IG90_9EUGL|mmetsp:Transcript_16506/g.29357  ORF Transcript_16506/g.29357 Transcript_16506/m.29357 type:complete len:301 (+) Transcript_16506:2126-3028(+)
MEASIAGCHVPLNPPPGHPVARCSAMGIVWTVYVSAPQVGLAYPATLFAPERSMIFHVLAMGPACRKLLTACVNVMRQGKASGTETHARIASWAIMVYHATGSAPLKTTPAFVNLLPCAVVMVPARETLENAPAPWDMLACPVRSLAKGVQPIRVQGMESAMMVPMGMETVSVNLATVQVIVAYSALGIRLPQSAVVMGTAPSMPHVCARMTLLVILQVLLVTLAKPIGLDRTAKKRAPGFRARFAQGMGAAKLELTSVSVCRALSTDSGPVMSVKDVLMDIGVTIAINNVQVVHAHLAS